MLVLKAKIQVLDLGLALWLNINDEKMMYGVQVKTSEKFDLDISSPWPSPRRPSPC